jgi:hypothetical protein
MTRPSTPPRGRGRAWPAEEGEWTYDRQTLSREAQRHFMAAARRSNAFLVELSEHANPGMDVRALYPSLFQLSVAFVPCWNGRPLRPINAAVEEAFVLALALANLLTLRDQDLGSWRSPVAWAGAPANLPQVTYKFCGFLTAVEAAIDGLFASRVDARTPRRTLTRC